MQETTRMTDQRWDIFCRIVDNYGDIGVCWRLAQQLSREYGLQVTLWIDRPDVAKRLLPALDTSLVRQVLENVTIAHWTEVLTFDHVADVVIEAFACELPESYLQAMAQGQPPVWINLDYLSAEPWVETFHLKPSPHPRLPLNKTFFFPGFTESTGGLLRERDLLSQRDAYLQTLTASKHETQLPANALRVSLFAYPQADVATLLEAMSRHAEPVLCLIPESSLLASVAQHLGVDILQAGEIFTQGALTIRILPFLSQADYDRLLWSCDLNFVRGEDSWIRAIWAGKPFIWQPYLQTEDTHITKLNAFLQHYLGGLEPDPAEALAAFHHQWAHLQLAPESWNSLTAALPILRRHAALQTQALAAHTDLAAKLVIFVRNFRQSQV